MDYETYGNGTVGHAHLPCVGGSPDGDGRRAASDDGIVAPPLLLASDKLLHNHNDSGAALIPHHSQRVVASTADNITSSAVAIDMSLAAEGARLAAAAPAPCGGCHGAGINPRFPNRPCDYCGGSGRYTDECRVELVDAITDCLSDTADLDVRWCDYARAVVALLERRGLDVTTLSEIP